LIVVGVMGAQSTGKSYLMNRLFGTRFTVSSARTTIGIWLSICKTP
jgi:GTPase SAR1 family protein